MCPTKTNVIEFFFTYQFKNVYLYHRVKNLYTATRIIIIIFFFIEDGMLNAP